MTFTLSPHLNEWATSTTELQRHASIQINVGKTQVWNAGGERPQGCDILEMLAPEERVWRGSGVPLSEQGIRVLGTPLGHPEYVNAQLLVTTTKHQCLLERIPAVPHIQSAWALLLHCAGARANCLLRVVRPELVQSFAERHTVGLWRCLASILKLSAAWDPISTEVLFTAIVHGRIGTSGCSSHQPSCVLVQLGRLFAHDQVASSRGGFCHCEVFARRRFSHVGGSR